MAIIDRRKNVAWKMLEILEWAGRCLVAERDTDPEVALMLAIQRHQHGKLQSLMAVHGPRLLRLRPAGRSGWRWTPFLEAVSSRNSRAIEIMGRYAGTLFKDAEWFEENVSRARILAQEKGMGGCVQALMHLESHQEQAGALERVLSVTGR